MSNDKITISKAKVHNLKSVSLDIPKNKIVVITGPSGSGKSSLAFDTIYAEGQRRYIESLSTYARQFIGKLDIPDVEFITGLSPSIAIDQKSGNRNPRSTVGTVTEIFDHLRVLYSTLGSQKCPQCKKEIKSFSAQQIVKALLALPLQSKIQILSPVIENIKGSHKEEISKYLSLGFSRARIDGKIDIISDNIQLDKDKAHTIELIIDRIVIKNDSSQRLTDSVELALKHSNGNIVVITDEETLFFSENPFCNMCKITLPELEPRLFSFNSPQGACHRCNGLGEAKGFTKNSITFDPSLGVLEGAIPILTKKNNFNHHMVKCILEEEGYSSSTPLLSLSKDIANTIFFGSTKIYNFSYKTENSSFNFSKNYNGIIKWLSNKFKSTTSEQARLALEKDMIIEKCPDCRGHRLNQFALSTTINDYNIMSLCDLNINEILSFIKDMPEQEVSKRLLKEISSRLSFLNNVGLNYLSLNRSANTLSGGESQRIRLATQIGSALSGIIYVLDEPSIGLHARDNSRLIQTFKALKELNNTVIVVEHDEATIRQADYIIDIGPHAGIHGGNIVATGDLEAIINNPNSITGRYLSKEQSIPIPSERRKLSQFISLTGANENNILNLDIKIPLNGIVCITGVSGSGKSTLIHNILAPAIRNYLTKNKSPEKNNFQSISGLNSIKSIIELDQSPIGRTPNSNPATYTGLFDPIRTIYSSTPESKARGYNPGRFSFNIKGGRCETCEGNGVLKIEMHFLPDVYTTCPDCKGKRYNQETLSILYKGKSISEVLDMSIEDASEHFKNHSKMARILKTLINVGLGYIKLGQAATTLSGGEAQRLRLARELAKQTKGHCLYILDEPTTGLHFSDIQILLSSLSQLVDQNNSMIIIEHNMDVIKCADYIIDLGPDGGNAGGRLVTEGTPEQIQSHPTSYTGKFLKEHIK